MLFIFKNSLKGGDIINDFLTRIVEVLKSNFPEINIYNEESEQALSKPYFFAKILNSDEVKELNRRYKRTVNFEISYVSDSQNINGDCLNKADTLYELLEIVEVEAKKYLALNKNHEVKDKTLYFRFQLTISLLKNIEENSMKELEVDVNGK